MKEIIRRISMFSELNDQELDLLVKAASEVKYTENSCIVSEGEAGCSLFIILSGEVKAIIERTTGGNVILSTMGKEYDSAKVVTENRLVYSYLI